MRVEFPSKPLSETSNLTVDFVSRLSSGETIASASVAATVYSGTDTSPASILNGAAQVSGTKVIQSITGGVVGTIYELAFSAVTNPSAETPVELTAQTLVITGYFAVVPDLP